MSLRKAPPGPRGVFLEYQDGSRYDDLPVLYIGKERGRHVFEIMAPRGDERPTSIGVGELPGGTSLRLAIFQYDPPP